MSGTKLPGLSEIEDKLRREDKKEASKQQESEVVYIEVYWNTWYFRKRFITLFFSILAMMVAAFGYTADSDSISTSSFIIFFTFVAIIVLLDQIIIGYTFFKGDIRSVEIDGRK